jgi:TPR repeat protein
MRTRHDCPQGAAGSVRQSTHAHVGLRTDWASGKDDSARMNKTLGIVAFTLLATLPGLQAVHAQSMAKAAVVDTEAARQHSVALALEKRGDERGAFAAYLAAAEQGHPPAQRRLGEIFDTGNSAVKRNYEESIRWYQKARENGEDVPPPKPRLYGFPPSN